MKDQNHDPKISSDNVESYVRAYGNEMNPERKAALLSKLDNQESVFIKHKMEQSQVQSRQHTQSRRQSQ